MRTFIKAWLSILLLALAPEAQAQTVLFSEDWEGTSERWRAVDANPIVVQSDADVCTSRYVRETVRIGGGRIIARTPSAVRAAERYCLGAWIRGSAGTQPFMGFYTSDAAGTTGGTHYWMIGFMGYGSGFPGGPAVVTSVTSDGAWRWLTSEFTMVAGITHIVPMIELFSAGSPGSADFDNITVYEGGCPEMPPGGPHTACTGTTPVCSSTGRCVQCATSAQCSGATPVCEVATSTCVGCLADSDCRAPTARCETARRVCVGCRSSSDCSGTTPLCDPAASRCVACTATAGCTGATPLCLSSGACGLCTATDRSRCVGATPVCDLAMGRCIRCTQDGECGEVISGRVCDVMTGGCAAGCVRAPGRNGCPEGRFCTSEDPARVGVCTTGCGLDADCVRAMPERPRCLSGDGGMNTCVGCRADAECAGRMDGRTLCHPSRMECVACTDASRAMRCTADGAGSACLMTGECGCVSDSDCGSEGSGRVCSAAMMRCVPGCRAAGNNCSAGLRCELPPGGDLGRCEAIPVDAGVTDSGTDAVAPDAVLSDLGADTATLPTDAPRDVAGELLGDVSADQGGLRDASLADVSVPESAVVDSPSVQDLGATPDAARPPTVTPTGGCGCRTHGGSAGDAAGLIVMLGALAARRRRR